MTSDGPDHLRFKQIVGSPLRPTALSDLTEQIERAADDLVVRFIRQGEFDGMADFARQSWDEHGVEVRHASGMTETSPVGTVRPSGRAHGSVFIVYLNRRIAKWWMPDEVHFLEVIPLGTTGKIDKRLGANLKDVRLRAAD